MTDPEGDDEIGSHCAFAWIEARMIIDDRAIEIRNLISWSFPIDSTSLVYGKTPMTRVRFRSR